MRNLLLRVHILLGVVVAIPALGWSLSGLLYALPNTVQGGSIDIKVVNGTVMINDAKVLKADVKCKNGVIHVIDSVILPK